MVLQILCMVLTASATDGFQPGSGLPLGLDSALTVALDTLDLTVEQLDFDRHWATGVNFADSTVVRALQNLMDIPFILEEYLSDALLFCETELEDDKTDPLVRIIEILEATELSYQESITNIPTDSLNMLLLVVPQIWLSEDNPLDWEEYLTAFEITVPDSFAPDEDDIVEILAEWQQPGEINVTELTEIAAHLSEKEWADEIPVTLPGVSGTTVSFCFEGTVRWVIGGRGSNTYSEDCPFELIIDLGGNDSYGNGLGGVIGLTDGCVSLIIDLDGNDRYESTTPVSQGCGIMGMGGVIDLAGNDVYEGENFTQGAGIMGDGFLIDVAGNDYFEADAFSQGAGCMGRGILLDTDGNDIRRASQFAQGFGGPMGEGSLIDYSGDDCYLAGFRYSHEPLLPDDNQAMAQGFAMGLRPLIAGGIGLLADFGNGNDTYRAEVFGQGSAYYYGLGMLYDEEGQDTYNAAQYSQGSGIHLASGCLWDGNGDDSYFSRNGPAQGSAHDLSTGFLLDGGGNDWYCSDGGQALSLTNSACIFIDVSGRDTYTVRNSGQGEVQWRRGSAGGGIFIDMADEDVYLGYGADSLRWVTGGYGVGIDLAAVTVEGLEPQDLIGSPEELELDSLFKVASEWEVGPNRDRVQAHREELAERGGESVEYIIENHLGTLSGLAIRAMEKVFEANRDCSIAVLLAYLESSDGIAGRELGNTIYFLGKLEDERARLPLEELLITLPDTASAGRISGVIKAIGLIGNPESLPVIMPFAGSAHERVRRQVAVSLGEIGDIGAEETLLLLAQDFFLDVRSGAERALGELDYPSTNIDIDEIDDDNN